MQNHNNYQPSQRPARGGVQETSQRSSAVAQPPAAVHPRNHSEDSWVEIGSRPSSSSLSSAADTDIVTTGLRVQHDSNLHRQRRRPRNADQFRVGTGHRVASGGGDNSSQEEYDESESESDRVLTSSNEGIGPSPLQNQTRSPYSRASSDTMSEREDDDDDENATAVNYPRSSRRQFEPRPNAFTHPSNQPAIRSQSGTAYTPRRPAPRTSTQRHSYPSSHSPYNILSPTAQAEHDEVLRASLSTLLSAAAAVRGLPKPGQPSRTTTSTRVDPTTLRMVPESALLGDIQEEARSTSTNNNTRETASSSSPHRSPSTSPSDHSKRKAATSPPPPLTSPTTTNNNSVASKDHRRAVKKVRGVGPLLVDDVSPTLLTWVISASVLAIVGVVSFSTGYSLGREAGHAEAASAAAGGAGEVAGACGKEVGAAAARGGGLGIRRLRWSAGSGVRV